MWRTRAVVSMLVEDIAGLKPPAADGQESQEALARAIRRTRLVIIIDWLAILILFLFRDTVRPFLPADRTVETVFTMGVLAVAAHAGYRWGQLDRYRAVEHLCEELRQRQDS